MPLKEDIGEAYRAYYTHRENETTPPTILASIYERVSSGYLTSRFGYPNRGPTVVMHLLGSLMYLIPLQRENLDFSVMYLPYVEGGRMLEIGCGNGRMLRKMADLGWIAEGIDFDPEAAKHAVGRGLVVRVGDLREQAYPDASFDAITMSHVIEHVFDPRSLIAECNRVLKPGGRLVMVTPNSESFGHRWFKGNWRGLEPPRHLFLFTSAALACIGLTQGFEVARCATTAHGANWHLRGSLSIRQKATGRRTVRLVPAGVWAKSAQIVEWAALKFWPRVGEEIVIVLQKAA